MKRLLLALLAALCLFACPRPQPVNPPVDGGTGGVAATGGAAPVLDAGVGGGVTTGGSDGTGGASVAIEWPECSDAVRKATKTDVARYRRLLRKPYPMRKHPKASYVVVDDLPDVFWLPLAPTLSQRRGSCTANAVLQGRVSQPWTWGGTLDADLLQDLADDIYSGATRRDPFAGAWPPNDTGSDGASALAEARDRGLVSGWVSVYSIDALQRELQTGTCILGANWYTGEFTPDRCGNVSLTGIVEGGHEVALKGVRQATKQVLAINSWDNDWGAKLHAQGGFFWLKFGDVQRLLNEGGEIECLRVVPANDNSAQPLRPTG